MTITEGRVTANGVEFACLETGSGPLALCVHGFPDSAWTWRHLMPELAAAGFRAVAPFTRGYAPTDVPADGRYQTGMLASDICELHQALDGDGDAVLIGHDWGVIAAYPATSHTPERWRRLVAMSVPPLAVAAPAMFHYRQLRRSWYIFFFQHALSDVMVSMNDLDFIDHLWADWSPGYDATEDLAHVKDSLRDPANLAAALGYYRAMLGDGFRDPALEPIDGLMGQIAPLPTLYLHGDQDGCMGLDVLDGVVDALAPDSRFEVIAGAGHFLHLEQPDVVNRHIIDFITA